jgi:hypothetical protein
MQNDRYILGCVVLRAVVVKSSAFRVITPCNTLKINDNDRCIPCCGLSDLVCIVIEVWGSIFLHVPR